MKFVLFHVFLVICVSIAEENFNCERLEKCSECIRRTGCVWCSNPKFDASLHCRSENVNGNLSDWCSENDLFNPQITYEVITDRDLNSGTSGEAVQIKPQRIQLSIRKGKEHTFTFQYASSSNYPVDMYYIMDLSSTMRIHKEKLAKLGGELAKIIRESTTDFKLGFGSFVDKPVMPYSQTMPGYEYPDCKDCVPPYSFRNHLSLTNDYNSFTRHVENANSSSNMDWAEGGFDALMQAMVCKKDIGWRDNARHLIIFSTDYLSHVAGDGKLGGIFEPNDGVCHMENNEYLSSIYYDYPSIGHLEYVAKLNNMHIIFAIPEDDLYKGVYDTYAELSNNFANSYVDKLENDSSNVVQLIKDIFDQITDSVHITDDAPSTIEIKYANNKCGNPTYCSDVLINEVVEFSVTIRALECFSVPGLNQILIKPVGINESLIIELEVICNCDCEKPTSPSYIYNATKCNAKGSEICGVCDCYEGHLGGNCECQADKVITADESNCRKDSSNEICSGLGVCKCGKCSCSERPGNQLIYGKYCECDNFSCKRVRGELCSGPEHGRCDCGKCECLSGWTGEACDCSNTNATCIAPRSSGEDLCSGRGRCLCGECQCVSNDGKRYSGKYCEECASCPGRRCQELLPCVEMLVYNSTESHDVDYVSNCTEHYISTVEKIDEDTLDEDVKICRELDKDGCTIIFDYMYDDKRRIIIEALREKICPKPTSAAVLAAIIITSIIIGGLIMLAIWKLFTYIHDMREYAKFEQEVKDPKWNIGYNPLFKEASTTYMNPSFGAKRNT